MATTDTWSNPNYAGELFLVGKNRTPLLNAIGGLGVGSSVSTMDFPMTSEWSLDAAAQPAISETASLTAPANNNYTRGQVINTCQIFQESVYVSYVKQSTPGAILTDLSNGLSPGGTNAVTSELDFQVAASLRQVAFDADYTLINGVYAQATDAATASKTMGLLEYISTNTLVSGTGSAGALAKADVNTVLISMVDNGAPLDMPVMVVNSTEKTVITDLYEVQPRDFYVGGGSIDSIITDFATIPVMYDPHVPAGTFMIVDMAYVKPVFCAVPGKGVMFYEELSRTGAGTKGQIYGQMGFDFGPEKYHGKITSVTV